tara:strand:+ start:27 stop:1343 length:1317 start_codon:yes stop_codon:yes gene_type:complete
MADYLKDMFIEVRERDETDQILDLVYETVVKVSKAPVMTEMASDRAREFVLSLPKFVPTEAWGDPNSMERQQITKLFNVMGGGRSIEGKLQFLQRIVDPNSRISSPRRIISSIIILEALKAVITSFNASSAGFVFEGFLSALLQGTQEAEVSAKGNLPIQDLIAFSDSDRPVPISLKLLNKTTNIEGSYTNLVDGLDEFGEMVYIVARKDKEAGGIVIEKFRFDQNNFIDALSTSARGGKTKGAQLFQLPDKSPEESIVILKASDNWEEKYNLLQYTAGYSDRVRKKRELASQTDQAAQENPDSEEAMQAQLGAQQELSEAVQKEMNLLLEKAGGTQWHISPKQLVSYDFVEYENLGELPYSEEAILNVARIHMDKLNVEIMELFNATQDLSENVNSYFLVEKRSTAINSGNKAIQDSVKIQQTLQAQLNEPDDENSP